MRVHFIPFSSTPLFGLNYNISIKCIKVLVCKLQNPSAYRHVLYPGPPLVVLQIPTEANMFPVSATKATEDREQ